MSGFKTFLLRGNLVDMSVGIVIGVAFGTVVTAFVKDVITPIIAALVGQPDFSGLYFTINNSRFLFGEFINAVVAFLIVAAVLYFLVVAPYARLRSRFETPPVPEPAKKECPRCLSAIPVGASRCAFCAADLDRV
ncbi:large conductance mechanosensitive channel protein MscL [bacterium]|nr:MAG: large conductance mechanosensitive channel protein MscL [bacterium]